jgi:hypothetical protein
VTLLLDIEAAPTTLYRVGNEPDPWDWPGRSYIGGERWDDPRGEYRVLYASYDRIGALLEVFAKFRPGLDQIAKESDPRAASPFPMGVVPLGWLSRRVITKGVVSNVHEPLVKVGGEQSLAALRRVPDLAALLVMHGVTDLDTSTIRSADGVVTRAISRVVFDEIQASGEPYAGIYYLSRYSDYVANCALFGRAAGAPVPVTLLDRSPIEPDDPDVKKACSLLDLEIGPPH